MIQLKFFKKWTFSLIIICLTSINFLGCGNDGKDQYGSSFSSPTSPPFISIWRTSNNNEAIVLPLPPGYNYNFKVNWGDGSFSEITTHDDSDTTHTYAESGDYTVTISGTLEAWNFEDIAPEYSIKLISVKDLGDVGWKNLNRAFSSCRNLESLSGGNVSSVTSMNSMFYNAIMVRPEISHWDTSKVTDMGYMFSYVGAANPDVSRWDTSNVTNMSYMFSSTETANPDVRLWDTSKVTNMSYMFSDTGAASPDISRWDTSKVTDMSNIFSEAQVAQPNMAQWNFHSVTTMESMLEGITLPTDMYSHLLNQIHSTSQQDDVEFHGGNSQYNNSAVDARNALIARNWTIIDQGLDNE